MKVNLFKAWLYNLEYTWLRIDLGLLIEDKVLNVVENSLSRAGIQLKHKHYIIKLR